MHAGASGDAAALRERLLRERADVDSRLLALQTSRSALSGAGAPSVRLNLSREPSRGAPVPLPSSAPWGDSRSGSASDVRSPYGRYPAAPSGSGPSSAVAASACSAFCAAIATSQSGLNEAFSGGTRLCCGSVALKR